MKLIIIAVFIVYFSFADELNDIESIIQSATVEFEEAKEDNNITKLTAIAKKLYDNHHHIKKLKEGLVKAQLISFICDDKPCKKPILQAGDNLSVIFSLSFDESEEYEKSIFMWQLQNGKNILKNKTKELYEKGGSKKFKAMINIDESFQPGEYRVAMHHKQSSGTIKNEAFFVVSKPLNVNNIIASTNKEATISDKAFYIDEDIYLLLAFTLKDIQNKINIDVKLLDTTKDKILVEKSLIRPKKDNNDTKQKLTFRIPSSRLYENQKLKLELTMSSDKINPIHKEIIVPIQAYKLIINAPSSLESGKSSLYSIVVPKKFVEPLNVDIEPSAGILLSHTTKLTGSVEAINKDDEYASIKVKVTDANGKVITSNLSVNLLAKKKEIQEIIINRNNDDSWILTIEIDSIGSSYDKNFGERFIDELGLSNNDLNRLMDIVKKYDIKKITLQALYYPDNLPTLQTRKEFFFQNGYLNRLVIYDYCKQKVKFIRADYKVFNNMSYEEKNYRYSQDYLPSKGHSCSQVVVNTYLYKLYKESKSGKTVSITQYDEYGSIIDVY